MATQPPNPSENEQRPSAPPEGIDLILSRILDLCERNVARMELFEDRLVDFEADEDGTPVPGERNEVLKHIEMLIVRNTSRLGRIEMRLSHLASVVAGRASTPVRDLADGHIDPDLAPIAHLPGTQLMSTLTDMQPLDPEGSILEFVRQAMNQGSAVLEIEADNRIGLLRDVIRVISDQEGLDILELAVSAAGETARMTFAFSDWLPAERIEMIRSKVLAELASSKTPEG
jgi:hypothetical protein